MRMKWRKEIRIEDLPNKDLQIVAELCGLDVALSLIENLDGVNIYIPKFSFRRMIKCYVQRHYNGHNAKQLALELGITDRMVYKLLKEK